MEKLISMTAFISEQRNKIQSSSQFKESVLNYHHLLIKKLELWMFVPYDKEGDILKKPERKRYTVTSRFGDIFDYHLFEKDNKEYEKQKEHCLFEGIEYVEAKNENEYSFLRITQLSSINYPSFWDGHTVEDLIRYNLKLTPNAKKQIGL